MPQPLTLIDQVFGKLTVRYGRDFLSRWEGLDISLVKADWAEELHGLSTASMLYALEHLDPAKPPTVGQFRDLCLRGPSRDKPEIGWDGAPIPPRVAAELDRAKRPQGADPKDWAHRLCEIELRGGSLTKAQRDMHRRARGLDEASPADALGSPSDQTDEPATWVA